MSGKDAIDWETARTLCQNKTESSDLAAIPETGEQDLLKFLGQITKSAADVWWLGPHKLASGASWLNPDGSLSKRGGGLAWVGEAERKFPRYLALCANGTTLV